MIAPKIERTEKLFAEKHPLMTLSEASSEASRCLYCWDAPCTKICPTHINVPQFIKRVADGNIQGSAHSILESNLLGYSCARVCPVEVLCVGACVYNEDDKSPIQIGRLQRFAIEEFWNKKQPLFEKKSQLSVRTAKRVALVGAGPASLSCAGYLVASGVNATIFEKKSYAGGLNTDGIAPYKIQAEDAAKEIAFIQSLGVQIKLGQEVGKEFTFESLCRDYDAVFIGCGLAQDKNIFDSSLALAKPDTRFKQGDLLGPLCKPQKNVQGVFGAMELISAIKMKQTFVGDGLRDIVVIGGGNTALDVVQELAFLVPQANIVLVYRRSAKEMSGYAHELTGARKKGVRFTFEAVPQQLLIDTENRVTGVEFNQHGKKLHIPAQMVVQATGQEKQNIPHLFPGVEVLENGCIQVNPQTQQTSLKNVYAGGDAVNGGKEVVNAVQHGKVAALAMLRSFDIIPRFGKAK